MLSTGCPGILLYGRRRMGKSTVLKNLTAEFLDASVIPVTISLQNPNTFTSLEYLLNMICESIQLQLKPHAPASNASNLAELMDFLTTCNDALGDMKKRLMLAFDEYENFDRKIGEGIFPEDLLATIRESIQTHRNITWIFTGSHEIQRLRHAPWTSYLIGVRTVEVQPFTIKEAKLLLTDPLRHSPLLRDHPESKPRFGSEFWGENGIEQVYDESAGWPYFTQLIAETVVDLFNNEEATTVTPDLFERALNKAIVRGEFAFIELLEQECHLEGEKEYLWNFRRHDTQQPPDDEDMLRSLKRRLLVVEEGSEVRMRVPLMQRWLRERG